VRTRAPKAGDDRPTQGAFQPGYEIVCPDSGSDRNEPAPAAGVGIADPPCLKIRATTLVRRLLPGGRHIAALALMHVHHGQRFTEPNSQVPLNAARDSLSLGKGKTVRIDAGRGHSASCHAPCRADGGDSRPSAPSPQVRALHGVLRCQADGGVRTARAEPGTYPIGLRSARRSRNS
jgi:hypothetical protein